MPIWIKFCGTTNLLDAWAASEAGADAVGFIFAPSPRRIRAGEAGEIIRRLPPELEKIGVFVDQPVEEMLEIAQIAGLTGIQLHGSPAGADMAELGRALNQRSNLRLIRTVKIRDGWVDELEAMLASVEPPSCMLLDSGAGSGRAFAWDKVRPVIERFPAPIIVAGGLTPENVAMAIATLSPWGVDVVTGVEERPGQKDRQKLTAFVDSVRRAERQSWPVES